MKQSLVPLSFADAIQRVHLGEHQLLSMMFECMDLWKGSSVANEQARYQQMLDRLALDETFEHQVKNVLLESIAVSGLLVVLDANEDVAGGIATLQPCAHEPLLTAFKREIVSRGLQLNRRASKVTGLPWSLLQERMGLYVAH